jgi:hypothetical protein
VSNDNHGAAYVLERVQGWAHALIKAGVGIVIGHVRRYRLVTNSA